MAEQNELQFIEFQFPVDIIALFVQDMSKPIIGVCKNDSNEIATEYTDHWKSCDEEYEKDEFVKGTTLAHILQNLNNKEGWEFQVIYDYLIITKNPFNSEVYIVVGNILNTKTEFLAIANSNDQYKEIWLYRLCTKEMAEKSLPDQIQGKEFKQVRRAISSHIRHGMENHFDNPFRVGD